MFLKDPLVVELSSPGPLTSALFLFLHSMKETEKGPLSPKILFNQLSSTFLLYIIRSYETLCLLFNLSSLTFTVTWLLSPRLPRERANICLVAAVCFMEIIYHNTLKK